MDPLVCKLVSLSSTKPTVHTSYMSCNNDSSRLFWRLYLWKPCSPEAVYQQLPTGFPVADKQVHILVPVSPSQGVRVWLLQLRRHHGKRRRQRQQQQLPQTLVTNGRWGPWELYWSPGPASGLAAASQPGQVPWRCSHSPLPIQWPGGATASDPTPLTLCLLLSPPTVGLLPIFKSFYYYYFYYCFVGTEL